MGKFRSNQPNRGQQSMSNNETAGIHKKPFDKAKWREKKYSNKARINRFEDLRRKTILREYYKELQKTGATPGTSSTYKKDGANRRKSLKPHEMVIMEVERLKQEKENKRLERQRILEERKAALVKYNNKKNYRFSKLSKKTQRGQPVMAGRMELLLEKIQKGM